MIELIVLIVSSHLDELKLFKIIFHKKYPLNN